ncbi:phage replisome organizer N-terminal domain-containing protein [Acetobacterium carbinolicum]|uniref:phage replisome organizer N-terminal domain-containing protein n=1 Tax=Acetobacterium carbinolicum TaxID=52690 RepID=UPI0039BF13C8
MDNSKDELYVELRDDFFDDETIIALESLPNGYLYINILMQMYLISLRSEGKIKNNAVNLSYMTEESNENVETAIKIFIDFGIIKIMGDGVIDMMPDDGKLKELVWLKTKDTIG